MTDSLPAQMAVVDPLLAPLDEPQQALFTLIEDVWFTRNDGPRRAYLDHELSKQGHDLNSILSSLPVITEPGYGLPASYGLLAYDRASQAASQQIALTVAGRAHLAGGDRDAARVILTIIKAMSQVWSDTTLDPLDADELRTSVEQLASVTQAMHIPVSKDSLTAAESLLAHEPPLWGGRLGMAGAGNWEWRLSSRLLHYVGVTDLPDYLARVRLHLDPPRERAADLLVETSDASLPDEIDFLDIAWTLWRGGARLFRLPDASTVASLNEEGANAAEFDARCSALIRVFKSMTPATPPERKHPVAQLKGLLISELPEEAHPGVIASITVLEAVSAVRNAGQHTEAQIKAVDALRDLGLPFPITDHSAAWQRVRGQAAGALAAIRTEVIADYRAREV